MSLIKSPVTQFILKALGIFSLWYVIYELWLLPKGELDLWLSLNIVAVSDGIIQAFGYDTWTMHRIIGIGKMLYPLSGWMYRNICNWLIYGVYNCLSGDWDKRISFTVLGIGVIYLVNIFRIVVLVITQEEWIEFLIYARLFHNSYFLYCDFYSVDDLGSV